MPYIVPDDARWSDDTEQLIQYLQAHEGSATVREISAYFGWSYSDTRFEVDLLADCGYLTTIGGGFATRLLLDEHLLDEHEHDPELDPDTEYIGEEDIQPLGEVPDLSLRAFAAPFLAHDGGFSDYEEQILARLDRIIELLDNPVVVYAS